MSNDTIVTLLADYVDALKAEEFVRASEVLTELLAEYRSIRSTEQTTVRRAIVARDRLDLNSENFEILDILAETYLGVQFGRSGFTGTAGMYETSPDEVDTASLRERASSLTDREQQFINREEAARKVLKTVKIPAALGVVDLTAFREPIPLGTTQTINSLIQNVGDTTAEEVTIAASGPLLNRVSKSIGILEGGEAVQFNFDVEATTIGDTTVTVTTTAAKAEDDSRDRSFEVRAKHGFVTDAVDRLREVRRRIKENDRVSGGQQRSLIAKLNAAIDSIERAVSAIDDGRADQANDALTTAINQLGAFLNAFAASEDNKSKKDSNAPRSDLSEEFRGSVIQSVENVIEALVTAKSAAITD